MKHRNKILGVCLVFSAVTFVSCSDDKSTTEKTGKAGDNLDLYAVLHLLEKSSSPEAFEKSLNDKSVGVNNLDLNGDGLTDYIRVEDKVIDEGHVFVLQIPLDGSAAQDVAVIEISKTGADEASIQAIGDEDLYGKDFIVEPKEEAAQAAFVVATTRVVNVYSWPYVTHVYSPGYVVYSSPYYYSYYPVYWEPWPVVVYDVYAPTVVSYRSYYQRSDGYRFVNIHQGYHGNHRKYSKFVYNEKDYGLKNPNGNNGNGNGNGNNGNNGNGNGNGNGKDNNGNDAKGNNNAGDNGNDKNNNKGNADGGKGNDGKDNGGKSPSNDKPDNKQKDNSGGNDNKAPAPDKKQDGKDPSPKQPSNDKKPQGGKPK